MKMPVRGAMIAAVSVVALTGCAIGPYGPGDDAAGKIDVDLKVGNETVSGKVWLGAYKQLESPGQSVDQVREAIKKQTATAEEIEGVDCEPFEDNLWAGTNCTFDSVPFGEMTGAGSLLKVENNGDRVLVKGDAGNAFGQIPPGGPGVEMTVEITMPGTILEHDDSHVAIEGRTATYYYRGGSKLGDIRLVSEPGGGFPAWAIIVIAVVVLAMVGAVLFYVLKGRRTANAGGLPDQQWGGPGQQSGQWGQTVPGQHPGPAAQPWGQAGPQQGPPGPAPQQPAPSPGQGQWGHQPRE